MNNIDKNFDNKMNYYKDFFEKSLQTYLKNMHIHPPILQESMQYSLCAGGKRMRPILMYAIAEMLEMPLQSVQNFALAMEMLHTYSLIHDDLPAMDNATMRRNLPTNHIKFGEGQAILAGDALLTEALGICLQETFYGKAHIQAAIAIAHAAGAYGMVAGQAADILYQDDMQNFNCENLQFTHIHKTAKLLIASLLVPAYLYNLSEENLTYLYQFGQLLGQIYQMKDDILDVKAKNMSILGKDMHGDEKYNKLSAINIFGEEKCQQLLDAYFEKAMTILEKIAYDTTFLKGITYKMLHREG